MQCSLSHYHISCPDKFELARWYEIKLGFKIIEDVEALGETDGPVIVSGDGGKTGISIFSKKDVDRDFSIKCIPAFEIGSEDFLTFHRTHSAELADVVVYDHLISFSIYLNDPMGSRLELVCSDYQTLQSALGAKGIAPKRMNPAKDPAYTRRQRILCFGDSNTWGYSPTDGSRFPIEVRWTGVLQRLLGDRFLVIEEGLNGRTTHFDYQDRLGKNGLTYLRPCIDAHFPLDVAIICLGSNDAKVEFAVSATQIAEGLENCLKALKGEGVERPSPEIKIIVMSPALVDERFIDYPPLQGAEQKTKEFPNLYAALAKKYDATFVDLSTLVTPSKADGCHFDPTEHQKIAETLSPILKRIL